MPFSDYAIDRFISPELSQLTECNAVDLSSRFPEAEHWLANFILNSIFGHRVGEEGRRFCYLFLRRTGAAFTNYGLARAALCDFTAGMKDGSRKLLPYFRALHFFEATLGPLWQAVKLFSHISHEQLYQKGDGSEYEKLNDLYNISKHFNPADLPANRLHPVWITNHALVAERTFLSFTELEKLMVEVGDLATLISSCEWHNQESGNESREV